MKKLFISVTVLLMFAAPTFAMTTHTIVEGDTLWALAQKYYGDGTLYTILSEVNNISNPRTIRSGTIIKIPAKSDLEAIRETKDQNKRDEMINKVNGSTNKTNKTKEKSEVYTDDDLDFIKRLDKDIEKSSVKTVELTNSEK